MIERRLHGSLRMKQNGGSAPGEGGAEGVNNGRKRGANEDDEPPRDTERKKDEERQKN